MPDYGNDQLAALLEMQDVGEAERQLQQQQALAGQLRGQALAPSSGKDWGSQLARAMQGGLAGYSMNKENKLGAAASTARSDALKKAQAVLLKPQMPQVGMDAMPPDPRKTGMGYGY